jgi:hypothetical protein
MAHFLLVDDAPDPILKGASPWCGRARSLSGCRFVVPEPGKKEITLVL